MAEQMRLATRQTAVVNQRSAERAKAGRLQVMDFHYANVP
jgi:hypothetical protein